MLVKIQRKQETGRAAAANEIQIITRFDIAVACIALALVLFVNLFL